MSEFKNNLKQLRQSRGLTQSELADKLNISKSRIGMYETGKRIPRVETLEIFADFFHTDMNCLLNGTTLDSVNTLVEKYPNIYPITRKTIPILGEISCGKPVFCNEDKETFIEIGSEMNVDFCLKASGDSMTGARINDGDLVFIRRQSMVENGEIAAVVINDEALLKRVYIYPNKIVLTPENPKYEPLVYVNEELENVHILGKAVAFQSILR